MSTGVPTPSITAGTLRGFLLAALGVITGCASQPADSPSIARPANADAVGNSRTGGPEDFLRQVLNTDNGLEIRKWLVKDDSIGIARTLNQYRDGTVLDEAAEARLQRNGMRLVRIQRDDLDALLEAFGGTTLNANTWHGQMTDWRPIETATLGQGGRAVAIDGNVMRFDRGIVSLLARGWTVPTENGPRTQLEVIPVFERPRNKSLQLLVQEDEQPDALFPSVALDLQLEVGYAYVLTYESPGVAWETIDTKEDVEASTPADAGTEVDEADPEPAAARPRHVGPGDAVSAEVAAPWTAGELLMAAKERLPRRVVLVFIPRIPEELFPPVLAQSASTAAGN
jgi:hypothetical protein